MPATSPLKLVRSLWLRKNGESMETRGNGFKVTNQHGQLGHLQTELVSPLWPAHNRTFAVEFHK